MISIFTGDDRVRAQQEIRRILGDDYEVVDCADLTKKDLPLLFKGVTLFAAKRKILLRDFSANAEIYPELPKYLDTPHEIILFETKLDKRTATYKEIKEQIEIREFKAPPKTDFRQVFDIYRVAKKDGQKAVAMLKPLEPAEDPIKFTGLLVSQALKDFASHQGTKEKQILKSLARIDLQMKTTPTDPWLLVESFLLTINK